MQGFDVFQSDSVEDPHTGAWSPRTTNRPASHNSKKCMVVGKVVANLVFVHSVDDTVPKLNGKNARRRRRVAAATMRIGCDDLLPFPKPRGIKPALVWLVIQAYRG